MAPPPDTAAVNRRHARRAGKYRCTVTFPVNLLPVFRPLLVMSAMLAVPLAFETSTRLSFVVMVQLFTFPKAMAPDTFSESFNVADTTTPLLLLIVRFFIEFEKKLLPAIVCALVP